MRVYSSAMGDSVQNQDNPALILTTLPRRVLAFAFAVWMLWSRIHGYYRPILVCHGWGGIIIAVIVYVAMLMIGFSAFELRNRAEQILSIGVTGAFLLQPLAMLWPVTLLWVRTAQVVLAVVVTVAAVSLLAKRSNTGLQVSERPHF